jgi:hemerythrin-like domain-containing protein
MEGAMIAPMIELNIERPTDPLRFEHDRLREELEEIEERIDSLTTANPSQRRRTMQRVVSRLRTQILPHTTAEQEVLYPAIDQRVGSGTHRFTESMRYEHTVAARWIVDLESQAARPGTDARAFSCQAEKLLGLISAHLEQDEQVLFPILDQSMTATEFCEEIMEKMAVYSSTDGAYPPKS